MSDAAASQAKPANRQRSDAVSLAYVVAHIALVVAPVFIAAATPIGPWTLPLFLWFGATQHGLTNLMHETAHRHTFANRPWNEFLGAWILGPFFIADFPTYRTRHWIHHQEVGTDKDTKSTYLIRLDGAAGLGFYVRALLGIEAVKKFFLPFRQGEQVKSEGPRSGPPMLLTLLTLHAVFGLTLLAVGWFSSGGDFWAMVRRVAAAYGFVYLYAMASMTIIMATLRAVAEHQLETEHAPGRSRAALRNLRADPVSRLLLGCYGFADHATHHKLPNVPSYHLPRVTRSLLDTDASLTPRDTYWSVLARLSSRPSGGAAERLQPG